MMKKWRDISIRSKLILAVMAISLVSSMILTGVFVMRVGQNLGREVEMKLLAITEMHAKSFKNNFDDVQKITDTIEDTFLRKIDGKELTVNNIDQVLGELDPIIKVLAQNSEQGNTAYIYLDPGITGQTHDVYYADQDGDGVVERQAEILKNYYETGPNETDSKSWWFGPKETGHAHWTKPYLWFFDNGNVAKFVSYSKPLYIEDTFVGIVGSDLLYDRMENLIREISIDGKGYAFLLNSRDDFLVLPFDGHATLREAFKSHALEFQDIKKVKDLDIYEYTFENESVLASIAMLDSEWRFGIAIYRDDVFGAFYQAINFMVLLMLGVILMSGYGFYFVSKSIANPIIKLAEYVNTIEDGDYKEVSVFEENQRNDEIGYLKETIEQMVERLRGNTFYINKQNRMLKDEIAKNELMNEKVNIAFDALSSTTDGILIIDQNMEIIYHNQSLLELFGINDDALENQIIDLFPNIESDMSFKTLKEWNIKRIVNQEIRNYFGILHRLGDAEDIFLIIFKDITSNIHNEKKLNELKIKDVLTGYYNRDGFIERIKNFIQTTEFNGALYPIILINIDQFRSINDSIGFQRANIFLQLLADKLKDVFGDKSIIARTSGDEFGVFIEKDFRREDYAGAIKDGLERLGRQLDVEGERVYFDFRAGVSLLGLDANFCNEGMENAHYALNFAKKYGDRQVAFFDKEMIEISVENYQMIKGLREAIDNRDFEVVYQPKWDVEKDYCVGLEALARWSWNGKNIRPDIFIRVAEYNNMMLEIGEIIFEKTVKFVKHLVDQGLAVPVSINVSSIQFSKKYFEDYVMMLLEAYELAPEWIQIELTESILMHNREEAIELIESLRKKGVLTSIDDFGKGYSSLSYLKDFKVDTLKIDRDFVKDIPDKDDGSIAELIINLSKLLDLKVVAEGAESKEQIDTLLDFGCSIIQGYYISKPLDESFIERWLRERS
jgi:diguanylate cyclase (GGDEF)-like protein